MTVIDYRRTEPDVDTGYCDQCGETILVEDLHNSDEGRICHQCMTESHQAPCAWCGDVCDIEGLINYDGDLGCPDCVVKVHVCWIDDSFCHECGVKA